MQTTASKSTDKLMVLGIVQQQLLEALEKQGKIHHLKSIKFGWDEFSEYDPQICPTLSVEFFEHSAPDKAPVKE